MKISNETKVGILAAFALVVLILGFTFLKGKNIFSSQVRIFAKYEDADGLNKSNPVMLHGLQVGAVDEIMLINEGEKKILVKFHVANDVKIPVNSIARIVSSDLLGSKAIEILPGDATAFIKDEGTITGNIELSLTESISKVVAPVQQKVENLIGSVDTVVTALNAIFNEDTRVNLRGSFQSIRAAVRNIETTTGYVDSLTRQETRRIQLVLANMESITRNLQENNTVITRSLQNFAAITDSIRAGNLKKTIIETNQAMADFNKIIAKINSGQGSIGLLVNDNKLYENLNAASKNLDKLVLDLKANPSRYVNFSIIDFGTKKKKKHNDEVTNTESKANP